MVSKPSEATQEDQSAKSIVSLKNFHRLGIFIGKAGIISRRSALPGSGEPVESDKDSKVKTDKFIAEIQDNRRVFSNTSLNTATSFSYEAGNSNNYDGFVSRTSLDFLLPCYSYFLRCNGKSI